MVAVDICNLALSYLGDSATVASIDPPEGSAQAQHCARFYPIALRLMLESHQWNFITKRAYLAVVQTDYFNSWRFAYAFPSDAADMISVLPKYQYLCCEEWWGALDIYLWPREPFEYEMNRRDFQVELINGQPCILSNAEDAVGRYTVATVQPGIFPALFTDALAWKLASMLAGPLLKGDVGAAESKRCLQMHAVVAAQAMGQDANQKHENPQPIAPWIAGR